MRTPGYESAGGSGSLCLPDRIAQAVGDIRTGAIRLSVPLMDDVIQVGASGGPAENLQTGSIVVVRTPAALSVRRSDGRPLQARIIRGHDGCHPTRIGVFLRPVNRLTVQGAGGRIWWVPDGARICRCQDDLIQLLETIATFSIAKQSRFSETQRVASRR